MLLSFFISHRFESRRELISRSVVGYFEDVEAYQAMGLRWPPRCLLTGPPGSGKTQLLRWLANEDGWWNHRP